MSQIKITQLKTTISTFKKSLKKTGKIQNQLLSEIKLLKTQINKTKTEQKKLNRQIIGIEKNKLSKSSLKTHTDKQKENIKNIAALKQTINKEIRSLKIAVDLLGKKNLTQPHKSDSIDNIRELDILE